MSNLCDRIQKQEKVLFALLLTDPCSNSILLCPLSDCVKCTKMVVQMVSNADTNPGCSISRSLLPVIALNGNFPQQSVPGFDTYTVFSLASSLDSFRFSLSPYAASCSQGLLYFWRTSVALVRVKDASQLHYTPTGLIKEFLAHLLPRLLQENRSDPSTQLRPHSGGMCCSFFCDN